MIAGLKMKRQAVYVDPETIEEDKWHLLENIREKMQCNDN